MVNEGGVLWKYGVTSKAMEKQRQFCLIFGVPQGSAQLLPGEGACVTFYTLESLERGCMVAGDFSTSLEMTVRHVP